MKGRPSLYTEELGLDICKRLSQGESLRSICDDPEMPDRGTVLNWALDLNCPFFHHYARARHIQAELFAEEIIGIADQATALDAQVARLRVDTRKWVACKLLPKIYGEKIEIKDPTATRKRFDLNYKTLKKESKE